MFGTGIPKLYTYLQQTVLQRRDNNLILTILISYNKSYVERYRRW
jgi:hypothetical protein